jgi:hypothetical protein
MQSKFITMIRALVMLIALIGLPALAIWGLDRPLPPIVDHWMGRLKSQITGADPVETERSGARSEDPSSVPYELRGTPEDSQRAPLMASGNPRYADVDTGLATVGNGGSGESIQASLEVPTNPPLVQGYGSARASAETLRIEQRLRELGAERYLLERWGAEQQLYRFRCEMPFVGRTGFHQHFESTADSALQAMNEVLHKVDAWRTAGAERTAVIAR